MAWPENPKTIDQIPLDEGDRWMGEEFAPDTAHILCTIVRSNQYSLRELTGGDKYKEEILGSLLLKSCWSAANARERALNAQGAATK